MNPETIANRARKSISSYCMDECKAYCCRKGYLVLTKKQAELITKRLDKGLKSGRLIQMSNNQYSLNLSPACPALEGCKCTIHKSKDRPKACHEFPIFIEGKRIRFSKRCLAVRNDKLFPYAKRLISMGYRIY